MGAIVIKGCPWLTGAEDAIDEGLVVASKTFKIVLTGPSGCGKTQLMNRTLNNRFCTSHVPTERAELGIKTVEIDGRDIFTLQLWDLPSNTHDSFARVTKAQHSNTDGLLVVFSVDDRASFAAVPSILEMSRQHMADAGTSCRVPTIIVANKIDVGSDDSVTLEEVAECGRQNACCGIVGSSALTGDGMQNALKYLLIEMKIMREDRHLQSMAFATQYVICSGPVGHPAFDTPLKPLMESQILRGILCPVPLIVDLTVEYLLNFDEQNMAWAAIKHEDPSVTSTADLLVAALESDRHYGMLEIWNCRRADVVGKVLQLFLKRLPDDLVPSEVYTVFVETVVAASDDDEQQQHMLFRIDAVLTHLGSAQRHMLHAIVSLLAHGSQTLEHIIAVIAWMSPLLLGGWTKEHQTLPPEHHLLHLLLIHYHDLQWLVLEKRAPANTLSLKQMNQIKSYDHQHVSLVGVSSE